MEREFGGDLRGHGAGGRGEWGLNVVERDSGRNLMGCVGERGEQSLHEAERTSGGRGRSGRGEPRVVGGFYGAEKVAGWGGLEVKMGEQTPGVREESTGGYRGL